MNNKSIWKSRLKSTFLLTGLFTCTTTLQAQSVFTNVYNFSRLKQNVATGYLTNSDGAQPYGTLVLSGNTLYGTTVNGGVFGFGTVFAVNTDGSGFSNLYNFTITQADPSNHYTNYDGAGPAAGLALSNGILYGTTTTGGAGSYGSIFAINTSGANFTNLHSFQYASGAQPYGEVTVAGNVLYGTTSVGGNGKGVLFSIGIDGSNYTNFHTFNGTSDGSQPYGTLLLSGGVLYGTTIAGGIGGGGTVFRVNTDGSDFTNLVPFQRNGTAPYGGLVLSGNTLYGTTEVGGTNGATYGTVFSVNTDGTGFQSLHNFNHNTEGAEPFDGLLLSGNALYGTTVEGGVIGGGTVFKISTDGSSVSNLYNFTLADYDSTIGESTNSDGADPKTGLVLSNGKLYGTTTAGGPAGTGVVFAVSIATGPTPIPLNLTVNGGNVVLSWADPSFMLYSATNVLGTYTNIPGATSPFTNAITGTQKYFRLQTGP